jgi:uncharacterized protein (DUF1778 family)
MSATEKPSKAERIEIRVTPHEKALLMAAAQSRQTSLSDFLLDHGIAAAEREITTPRIFYASEAGWAAVEKLLDEDEGTPPSEAVLAWITKHRRAN